MGIASSQNPPAEKTPMDEPVSRAGTWGSGLRRRIAPLCPALLVLAFTAELGTFQGAAGAWQVLGAHGILWTSLLFAAPSLSRRAGLSLGVIWLAVALGVFFSPTPRAGLTVLALLPALLTLPWALARCWPDEESRALGWQGIRWTVAIIAAWSLVAWQAFGTPGASLPLGHHNLLAAWLATFLPLILFGPVSGGSLASLTKILALGLGAAALWATGSLSGLIATGLGLTFGLACLFWTRRRSLDRRVRLAFALAMLAAILVPMLIGGGRLRDVVGAEDLSQLARRGYAEAGWRGVQERPWLGWGAGATRWTLAEHLRPSPGVHPAGEIVADIHNLPLQLLYELGALGLLVILGSLAFLGFSAKRDGLVAGRSRDELAASAGLVALGISTLGGLDLSVTAIPVAAAFALGMVLSVWRRSMEDQESPGRNHHPSGRPGGVAGLRAGANPAPIPEEAGSAPRVFRRPFDGDRKRLGFWPALALTWTLFLWQLPRDLAHLDYDRAARIALAGEFEPRDGEWSRIEGRLQRAKKRDGSMPLYGWRLAALREVEGKRVVAERVQAAEQASGVAALWLHAAETARLSEDFMTARAAYLRACDLDPLGAIAPFRLALLGDGGELAVERAARALIAEPSLLAATEWPEALMEGGVRFLLDVEGVDPGWRLALEEAAVEVLVRERSQGAASVHLGLRADKVAAESMSLFAFRRRPWPALIARVELWEGPLAVIDLPPAASLALTDREIFMAGCRLRAG